LQCWKIYKECIKYIHKISSFHFFTLSKVLFNCRIHGNVKAIVFRFYHWSLNLKFGCSGVACLLWWVVLGVWIPLREVVHVLFCPTLCYMLFSWIVLKMQQQFMRGVFFCNMWVKIKGHIFLLLGKNYNSIVSIIRLGLFSKSFDRNHVRYTPIVHT
jgi:hypothetical protein